MASTVISTVEPASVASVTSDVSVIVKPTPMSSLRCIVIMSP